MERHAEFPWMIIDHIHTLTGCMLILYPRSSEFTIGENSEREHLLRKEDGRDLFPYGSSSVLRVA